MNRTEYQRFTDTLRHNLTADPRVIGLIAAGSMAGQDHMPDQWSDHDFWIVTDPGTQESFRAILSSHQQGGRWEPADEIQVLAICGEVTLDFTRAELPPRGMIEIDARAICGYIEIIVPDGAEIELEGEPFVGSIEQHMRKKGVLERIRERVTGERDEDLPAPPPPPEPPYFRIDGHAIFGGIKVMGR